MPIKIIAATALLLPILTFAVGNAVPWTFEDLRGSDEYFKSYDTEPPLIDSNFLFPDGARGREFGKVVATPVYISSPQFHTRAEQLLHRDVCEAQAIVIAKATAGNSALNAKGTLIFTRTEFVVEDELKAADALRTGDSFTISRLGGEITISGAIVRVQNDSVAPFMLNKTYLLILNKKSLGVPTRDYFTPDQNVIVSKGRVRPEDGTWYMFTSGTLLSDVKSEIARISTLSACRQ